MWILENIYQLYLVFYGRVKENFRANLVKIRRGKRFRLAMDMFDAYVLLINSNVLSERISLLLLFQHLLNKGLGVVKRSY